MANEIEVISPETGKTVKVYQKPFAEDILRLAASSKKAFSSWQSSKMPYRSGLFRRLSENILKNSEHIVSVVTECTGKTPAEALMSDIYPSIDILNYYIRNASSILKTKERKTPFLFGKARSYVEYKPFGTVLVISPWNFPFQLSIIPVISAVLAGNSVILKPSEYTLPVGEIIADLFKQSGFPENVVTCVCGDGDTGRMLIEAKPDKIFFTGSLATGKKIMAMAAEEVIPVELELGGKDPMIVFEDANLERAANGAVYGAFANSGQVCVSVERLYVQDQVHDKFLQLVEENIKRIRVGSGMDFDMGAITMPRQIEVIRAHVEEAVQKGAKLLTEFKIDKNFVYPALLSNVDHSMKIMREETFGPVLPVMRFKTEEEAVNLANDNFYGLNASVWTSDLEKGRRIASRLKTGNCAVNDVLRNIGSPYLPFGGVKKSGFGRYHAEDGLYAFSQAVSVMVNSGKKRSEINWFPYSAELYEGLKIFMSTIYGKDNIFAKAVKLISSLPKVKNMLRKQ